MKDFFRCIWYGVKAAYQENREIIIFVAALLISTIVVGVMGRIFEIHVEILIFVEMIAVIVSVCAVGSYFHYEEAREYSKEHKVSLKEAWENTRPADYSSFND